MRVKSEKGMGSSGTGTVEFPGGVASAGGGGHEGLGNLWRKDGIERW